MFAFSLDADSDQLAVGQMIGIVFGCIVPVAVLSVVCAYRIKRRKALPRIVHAPNGQDNGTVNPARLPDTVPSAPPQDALPSYEAHMSKARP